jgi:uncharacterized protein
MQELHAALLALQELDEEIARAKARVAEFAPQLETLEAPVAAAQRELEQARTRLQELRAEHNHLQKNAQQRQERLVACQERMTRVRNAREEAAVQTETDLVRRALQADQEDLAQLSEQVTRTDLKLDELERQHAKAIAEIAARREEILAARAAGEEELESLLQRRENHAVRLDPPSRRLYERLRTGLSRTVMAPLTQEGACGNCFNILPVQEQTEVQRGQTLHRCEGCGVILFVQ